jgi:hypothetical protein
MEHILQRQRLRCPLAPDYGLTWDLRDLDGGCSVWRRFQEKSRKHSTVGDRAHWNQIKQFALTVEKRALAAEMWQQRINNSADREAWSLEIRSNDDRRIAGIEDDINDKKESTVVDDPLEKKEWRVWSDETDGKSQYAIEDEDEDDDDNGTIYSRALADPPASHKVPSDLSLASSTTNVESYVTAPGNYESMMSLAYESFNWADDDEAATAAGGIATSTHPAPNTTTAYDAAEQPVASAQPSINVSEEQLAFRESLTQHVRAEWAIYEKERQAEALENAGNLGKESYCKPPLSSCNWKWTPLFCGLEELKAYALRHPTTRRCAYEHSPTIVVTNEDGKHFRLLEVRKILTEKEISKIRQSRDQTQDAVRENVERYNLPNKARRQGQNPTERLAVETAKAWWSAKQQARDATYIDWEHAEANELALLKRQIEREVDQYFEDSARLNAKVRKEVYSEMAKAAQTKHFANLKLKMAQDNLIPHGAGRYESAAYSVHFTHRALNTFLDQGG